MGLVGSLLHSKLCLSASTGSWSHTVEFPQNYGVFCFHRWQRDVLGCLFLAVMFAGELQHVIQTPHTGLSTKNLYL